tara:strand:+ start:31868 stop:32368 length:501 start_codon:yes stop_codon:yes gene_type:complete
MTYLEKYEKQERLLSIYLKAYKKINKKDELLCFKLGLFLVSWIFSFPALAIISIYFFFFCYIPVLIFSLFLYFHYSKKIKKIKKRIEAKNNKIESNKNTLTEPFLSFVYDEVTNGNINNIKEKTIKDVLNAKMKTIKQPDTVEEIIAEIEFKKRFQVEQLKEIINE